MTILSVVKDVCATVGVSLPQSIFSGITGNRTMVEMLACANEMAQRIAYDSRDWSRLKKTQIYTGDGTTTAFSLPADYKRMLLTANVWRSSNPMQPATFYPDTDEWLTRRAQDWTETAGEWTMYGGQIHIFPALAIDETAYFAYLNKNCVALDGGGVGDSFLNDNDTYTLDERVLKLGMTWKWKHDKGAAYADDVGTYGDALTMMMGHDGPAPIYVGRKPVLPSVVFTRQVS